jgi:NAD(P)-dependent dehydrogenase (short-subunit alcohol dehydrogenase family)
MKYELRQMETQGKGTIVNISSLGGLRGLDYLSVYVASKHGVLGLTKTAALEYAKKSIRINAVCPSLVRTGMSSDLGGMDLGGLHDLVVQRIPVGRLGEPNEIAEAVLWLCSDSASFVTGSIVSIDGGCSAR